MVTYHVRTKGGFSMKWALDMPLAAWCREIAEGRRRKGGELNKAAIVEIYTTDNRLAARYDEKSHQWDIPFETWKEDPLW
jgi:hypothetical protein